MSLTTISALIIHYGVFTRTNIRFYGVWYGEAQVASSPLMKACYDGCRKTWWVYCALLGNRHDIRHVFIKSTWREINK